MDRFVDPITVVDDEPGGRRRNPARSTRAGSAGHDVHRMGQNSQQRRGLMSAGPNFDAEDTTELVVGMVQRTAQRYINCLLYDHMTRAGNRRLLLNVEGSSHHEPQHVLAAQFIHNSQRAFWTPELLRWATNRAAPYAVNAIMLHALFFRG